MVRPSRSRAWRAAALPLLFVPFVPVALYACSSSSSPSSHTSSSLDASSVSCAPPDSSAGNASLPGSPASCGSPGAATPGPADTHCVLSDGGLTVQSTSPSSCCVGGDAGGPDTCAYNATMYGHEGDDDDCKYHVSWTSTALCEGAAGVEFTVVATVIGTDTPVVGASIRPEVFTTTPGTFDGGGCDDMSSHESASTFETFGEGPAGTYTGRVVFDASGQWTVRFHLNENCLDVLPDSPHGHAAFHVTLP